MLDTKEFRKRMVHCATNGEETDYDEILLGGAKTVPTWFVLGLLFLLFAVLPASIVIFFHGLGGIGTWNTVFVLFALSIAFFTLSYFKGKSESRIIKKKNRLMDYEYTLNPDEKEYLLWYRFNAHRESYPVCVIEAMLANIDRHSHVNKNYVNELNKLSYVSKR